MASTDDINPRPPGQQRPYPAPTRSGHITFTPPGTDLECKTHYSIWGTLNSTKTPLVCIHGGPGATSAYMKPFSLLFVDYEIPVIVYDQLGCGQSTHLRETKGDTSLWTVDLFVAELRNLLDALEISTFDLLGHSWGGQLAARFAAQQPTSTSTSNEQRQVQRAPQLRKLVIAQSTAYIAQRTPYFEAQMANLPAPHGAAALLAQQTGDTTTPAYKAAQSAYAEHHMCRVSPWPQEMVDCMAALRDDDTVSSTFSPGLIEDDFRPDLRLLTEQVVPGGMLVCNGKFDQSVDEVVRPYYELPSAKREWVQFGESSHMAMLEETEEVVRVVGGFLTRE